MKKLFLATLLFLSSCGTLHDNELLAQKYVTGTEDLPVYESFKPVDTKNVAYDSEDGRIIDANYFSSQSNIKDVQNFYAETLPQLGWKKKKTNEYIREGESLKIHVTAKGSLTFVKFSIRPAK